MINRDTSPYVAFWNKTGNSYRFPPEQWQAIHAAFIGGDAYYTARDYDGAVICVRLRDMEAVGELSEVAIKHALEREEAVIE